MLEPGVSSRLDLGSIISLLTQLIRQAEAGEWEAVVLMQPNVCQQLADLESLYRSPVAISNTSSADSARLTEINALINKAELACATRREQIAPLVGSLKALPDPVKA